MWLFFGAVKCTCSAGRLAAGGFGLAVHCLGLAHVLPRAVAPLPRRRGRLAALGGAGRRRGPALLLLLVHALQRLQIQRSISSWGTPSGRRRASGSYRRKFGARLRRFGVVHLLTVAGLFLAFAYAYVVGRPRGVRGRHLPDRRGHLQRANV